MGEGGIDEVAAVYTVKGVEGEIQAKCSYVEGGGCRACCLADWRGRAPKVAYLIEVGASLKLIR